MDLGRRQSALSLVELSVLSIHRHLLFFAREDLEEIFAHAGDVFQLMKNFFEPIIPQEKDRLLWCTSLCEGPTKETTPALPIAAAFRLHQ
jgi:hypothetical protein